MPRRRRGSWRLGGRRCRTCTRYGCCLNLRGALPSHHRGGTEDAVVLVRPSDFRRGSPYGSSSVHGSRRRVSLTMAVWHPTFSPAHTARPSSITVRSSRGTDSATITRSGLTGWVASGREWSSEGLSSGLASRHRPWPHEKRLRASTRSAMSTGSYRSLPTALDSSTMATLRLSPGSMRPQPSWSAPRWMRSTA